VAAAYMAVRGSEATRVEGVVWIGITCILFAAEMHFIAVERKSHDTEQAELRSREETTRDQQTRSFGQLIVDGKKLFQSLEEERKLTQKNQEYLTGGDGYCWVVPVQPLPVALGGDPAHQGDNYWQLAVKNSGKVVLPTCNIRFMPFPTDEELKVITAPPAFLFYPFEKVPVMGRKYFRYTQYFLKGDRIYSGVIEMPTRQFIEVIKFQPSKSDPTRYVPSCMVATPSGKTLEKDCNPQ
jgi:hypothetical protein